jgi:acetate---CoA ligase (ADP-forming)
MSQGADAVISAIATLRDRSAKALCIVWPFCPAPVRARLESLGFFVFEEPDRAITALASCVLPDHGPTIRAQETAAVRPDWLQLVPSAVAGRVVSEHDCHRVLAAAGLPVAAAKLVTDRSELPAAIRQIGMPVVMKVISDDVTHRQAAGLVALDLRTEREAHEAFHALHARASDLGLQLDGVYVQRLVRGSMEVLVSAFRDATLGMIVCCGAGGTLTELLDDTAFARAPVDKAGAERMLGRLRLVRRAIKHGSTDGLAEAAAFVAAFSRLAATIPWQRFTLEVNPVVVGANGALAVDALLVVDQP